MIYGEHQQTFIFSINKKEKTHHKKTNYMHNVFFEKRNFDKNLQSVFLYRFLSTTIALFFSLVVEPKNQDHALLFFSLLFIFNKPH